MRGFSDCASRRNECIVLAVFELKKEIPVNMFEPRTVKLKDDKDALIRTMKREDLEGSLAFFRALSEEDRLSLRRDLTTRESIEERIHEMEEGTVKRLVAVADETIVGDGALELSHFGWERHIAELRLIVATAYQHKGLGMLMAGALYDVAASTGIEEIVVKMVATQTAALRIFQKLGFRQEVVLRNYVKDLKGTRKDLVLMRCPLKDLWQKYEDFVHETDLRPFKMG
jgi:L-amino acid N-acyltransferase YncA